MNRRDVLRQGSLVLLLGTQQIARGATIVAVRVWPAPEYSRVTIESDAKLSSTQVVLTNPPRLAVDIEGLDLSPELRELVAKVRADDPFIAGIRASPACAGRGANGGRPEAARRAPGLHAACRWPPTSTGWCSISIRSRKWIRWRR